MYSETKQKDHTRHKRELFQILVHHKLYKRVNFRKDLIGYSRVFSKAV